MVVIPKHQYDQLNILVDILESISDEPASQILDLTPALTWTKAINIEVFHENRLVYVCPYPVMDDQAKG